MPTNTDKFGFYKPDLGQKAPDEWGSGVNNNFDEIDRLLYNRAYLLRPGMLPPDSPSAYDDEFDDQSFDTTKWTVISGNLQIVEDTWGELEVGKDSSDPDVVYIRSNLDLSNETLFMVYANVSISMGVRDINGELIGGGIYVASAQDGITDIIVIESDDVDGNYNNSNIVAVRIAYDLEDTIRTDFSDYSSEDIGTLSNNIFVRIVGSRDTTSDPWDLRFAYSYDGIHWRILYDGTGEMSNIDYVGLVITSTTSDNFRPNRVNFGFFRYDYIIDPDRFV